MEWNGILPKQEIQADAFIKQNENCDGRGIIVGIFDTGFDPGSEGLATLTTDGKPKVIDVVDASGGDDIDTSKVITQSPNADGKVELTGLTKRVLKIGKRNNPTNKWHLGVKLAYDAYPGPLKTRIQKERQEKRTKQFQETLAKIEVERANVDSKDENLVKEFDNRIKLLKDLESELKDEGPIYDCVVFHDGENWRAIVDTTETGEMENLPAMTDYFVEKEYRRFDDASLLNFVVNVYNEGNTLAVVTPAGAHGSHVAGIVGAYYPDQPELNGIAPGCQLMSIKIGDSRLGSMETGVGMLRGLQMAAQRGCHVINMSYGEAAARCDGGRFVAQLEELVNEYNIVFVSSAGNNGPALATGGAPGSTSIASIGVGAFVSPEMMKDEYSMRETVPENLYTWSSRGPTTNGALGVSICAPGGAIASVPQYELARGRLMNGTSMSSPNMAGGVALLLSAMKSIGKTTTPACIQKALELTAKPIKGVSQFGQGYGKAQLLGAFQELKSQEVPKHRLDVKIGNAPDVAGWAGARRGVYLRDEIHSNRVRSVAVSVSVVWPSKATQVPNEEKVKFEQRLTLSCDADWVNAPERVLLHSGGKTFAILVDARHLERNRVHYSELIARDETTNAIAFRVPITVFRPILLPTDENSGEQRYKKTFNNLSMHAGVIRRQFVAVPDGATNAIVNIIGDKDIVGTRRLVIHCVYLAPHRAFVDTEFKKYVGLSALGRSEHCFPVQAGATLEITLAQFWSSLGDAAKCTLSIEFSGIEAVSGGVFESGLAAKVDVRATLRDVALAPKASITHARRLLMPIKDDIKLHRLIDKRDLALDNVPRALALSLNYPFKLSSDAAVTVRVPLLSTLLYDSPFDGQFYLIYDENKKVVHKGDFRPEASKTLSAGSYVIALLLKAADDCDDSASAQRKALEAWKDRPIQLDIKLKQSTLSVRKSPQGVLLANATLSTYNMERGQTQAFYVVAPSKVERPMEHGDVYVGKLTLQTGVSEVTAVPLLWSSAPPCMTAALVKSTKSISAPAITPPTLPGNKAALPLAIESKNDDDNDTAADKSDINTDENKEKPVVLTPLEEFEETVRAAAVKHLNKLIDSAESFDAKETPKRDGAIQVYNKMKDQYANHLPLLLAGLKLAIITRENVEETAKQILSLIDENKIAQWFGVKRDDETTLTDEQKKLKKTVAEERDALKCVWSSLLLYRAQEFEIDPKTKENENGGFAKLDSNQINKMKEARIELSKWVTLGSGSDASDYLHHEVTYLVQTDRPATAALLARKDKKNKDAKLLLIRCLAALKWKTVVQRSNEAKLISNPPVTQTVL